MNMSATKMPAVPLTHHACQRVRQRAIAPLVVDLLFNYGSSASAGAGTTAYFFDHAARRRLRRYAGSLAAKLEEHLDCYLVATADGAVVTVGHRTQRMQNQ